MADAAYLGPLGADMAAVGPPQGTILTALWPCGAWLPMSSCLSPASLSRCMAWPSTPGMPESSPAWARVPSPCGLCSSMGPTSASRCPVQRCGGPLGEEFQLRPRVLLTRGTLVSLQVHRDPIPEEVAAGTLTSVCYGTVPLLYGGSNTGQVCVWDMQAHRCFLAWEADDGEIGGCPVAPSRSGLASPLEPASWVLRPCVTVWAPGQQPCHPCPRGVLLCSGARLVSSNNTRRLRLWAVGAVPELRCRGSGAR